MKSFPNQTGDVLKIARSVLALHELELEHDVVSPLAFGREITRRAIRWPALFPPDGDIEARMDADEAAALSPSQSSHGAAGRDYLRTLRVLGICDDDNRLTDLGEQTAELGHDLTQSEFIEHWHQLLWNLEHQGSHPYRHLLRIVQMHPGINTNILAMALEGENDGEEEQSRVDELVQAMLQTANTAQRVAILNQNLALNDEQQPIRGECTVPTFNNAAKGLANIAHQLGDIVWTGAGNQRIAYPNRNDMAELTGEEVGDAVAPRPQRTNAVNWVNSPDELDEFVASDSTDAAVTDPALTNARRIARRNRHRNLLRRWAARLQLAGHRIGESLIDVLSTVPQSRHGVVSEVKSLNPNDVSDARRQCGHALSQCIDYQRNELPDGAFDTSTMVAVFECQPPQRYIDNLESVGIRVVWWNGEQFTGTEQSLADEHLGGIFAL